MSSLATLISNVGFPIAAFVMMYRLYRKEKQEMRKERKKWVDSIDEHTEVLKTIRTQIGATQNFYRGGKQDRKPAKKSKSD